MLGGLLSIRRNIIENQQLTENVILVLSFPHEAGSNVAFSQGIYDQVTADVGYPKISQITFACSPGFIVTSDILTCGASV